MSQTVLGQIKDDCILYASQLGNYQKMSVDTLANGYCKATDEEDEFNRNCYLSALVLRFWYVINKLYVASPNIGMEIEDFYAWLVEAIDYACKYRAWQDPTKNVNARQAINQCITTIRSQHYYNANMDKRKANYNNISLDTTYVSLGEEREHSLLDNLPDEDTLDPNKGLGAISLVQDCINDKKIIDAIILDTIAFNDTERVTKKTEVYIDTEGNEVRYQTQYREPWNYKVVQILGNLPEDYKTYFSTKYHVSESELAASLTTIRKANHQKLYKYLDSAITGMRNKLGIKIA